MTLQQQKFRGLNFLKIKTDNLNLTKPTSFQKSDFIDIFQLIVDTYGTPQYKEFNPAVPAIVSFPFLFGVMFGDIMHGAILTCVGIYLCFSKREKGTLGAAGAPVRYLFLMMGFFAFYCGIIYNDFSSLPIMLSKSCWSEPADLDTEAKIKAYNEANPGVTTQNFKLEPDCVYPFGLDYTWMRTEQEIVYLNNFKMKTSVLYGVMQMLFGTTLRMSNQIYNRDWVSLVFEGITQFVMLVALFGFMDYMIIGKWTTDWVAKKAEGEQPPGVIMCMITMFLNGGNYDHPKDGDKWSDLVPNQTFLMQNCVIIAFVCVPLMLCVKPIWGSMGHKKVVEDNYVELNAPM